MKLRPNASQTTLALASGRRMNNEQRKQPGPRITALLAISLCLTAISPAPVAQAGIIDSVGDVENWFRADQGVSTSGSAVTQWMDQSGNADHANPLSGQNPTLVNSAINGQPVVRFVKNAAADDLGFTGVSHAPGNDFSFFAVVQPEASFSSGDDVGFFLGSTAETNDTTKIGPWSGPTFFNRISNGGNQGSASWPADPAPMAPRIIYVQRNSGNTITSGFDGATPGSALVEGDTSQINRIGGPTNSSTTQDFPGDVAELAFFSDTLNVAERILVENYLSSKYDIPLTGGGALDVYSGDTPGNGHFDLEVIGIGRQSGTTHTSSSGDGLTLSEANGSLNADGEFLLAGHNSPSNSIVSGDTPDGVRRWERVWFVDENGGGVDAEFTFDFSEAGLDEPDPLEGFTLLFSPTQGPFSFSEVTGISQSVSGDQVTFLLTDADILSGFYTLGITVIPEPATGALVGIGGFGLLAIRRRRALRAC